MGKVRARLAGAQNLTQSLAQNIAQNLGAGAESRGDSRAGLVKGAWLFERGWGLGVWRVGGCGAAGCRGVLGGGGLGRVWMGAWLLGLILCLQGCFIQDFNQQARLSAYKHASLDSHKQAESRVKQRGTGGAKWGAKEARANKSRSPAWARANTPTSTAHATLAALLSQQKHWSTTPYVSGGVKRSGADCSGFVQTVFDESFSLQIPRTTVEQMQAGKKLGGRHISHKKLRAGDLVFFRTGRGALGYHVGIYLEKSEFLHLSAKGGAKIASLENSYWKPKLIKAVRYALP